jgi:SEC-C motif domain protein
LKLSCYCGSSQNYASCCGPYHKNYSAPTAVALMRSRYSAFCGGNMEYIQNTMRGKALKDYDAMDAMQWAESINWISLEIVAEYPHPEQQDHAYVEFIARFIDKATLSVIHERSAFKRIDGRWYYTEGHPPKHKRTPKESALGRNTPCPCESGKKFKQCHGKG